MTLKEQFAVKVQDGFNGFDIGATAEECTDICVEAATDFLEWVFDNFTTPKDCPYSIPELWEQFKIERNL